jgi:hypothetical protein
MSSSLIGNFCWRILRAYRQHFPIQGGGAWVEDETLFFSFHHAQCTLFLQITTSNLELRRRLTVNLSTTGSEPFFSVDSTGSRWNCSKPDFFTPEELQSLESLASRFYLIALDSIEELRILTSSME